MNTGDPCTFGTCGALDTHPYAEGPRCDPHAPWARAGQPHPSTARYCLAICYCGTYRTAAWSSRSPITPERDQPERDQSGRTPSSPGRRTRPVQAHTIAVAPRKPQQRP